MDNTKHLGSLIRGIKSIISKNRSSFSDEEISLLKDCIKALKNGNVTKSNHLDAETILKLLSVFARPDVINLIKIFIDFMN